MAATQATATIQFLLCLGPVNANGKIALNYMVAINTLAAYCSSAPFTVPLNSTNQQCNLATLFPGLTSLVAVSVVDRSNPGQSFTYSPNPTGTGFSVPGGGAAAWVAQGAPPSIYFGNPSLTLPSNLEIAVLGN